MSTCQLGKEAVTDGEPVTDHVALVDQHLTWGLIHGQRDWKETEEEGESGD